MTRAATPTDQDDLDVEGPVGAERPPIAGDRGNPVLHGRAGDQGRHRERLESGVTGQADPTALDHGSAGRSTVVVGDAQRHGHARVDQRLRTAAEIIAGRHRAASAPRHR